MASAAQKQAARAAMRAEQDEQELLALAIGSQEDEIFGYAAKPTGHEEDDDDGDTTLEKMNDPLTDEPIEDELIDDSIDEDDADPADMTEVNPITGKPVVEGEDELEAVEEEEAPAIPERDPSQLPSWRRPAGQGVDPEVAALRERLARLEGQQQPRQERQEQVQDETPDPVLDPKGFMEAVRAQARADAEHVTATARLQSNFETMEAAYDREGRSEEFRFASQNLERLSTSARSGNNADGAIVRSIINARDPAHALMQWAEDNLDLANFRETREGQTLEQAARMLGVSVEDLQALRDAQGEQAPTRTRGASQERQQQGRPQRGEQRQRGRLPSLNGAGSGGREGGNSRSLDPRGSDGSEGAIFDFALQQ